MKTILILGSKGMLGGELQKMFPQAIAWDREDADVTNNADLRLKIFNVHPLPSAIINCVAYNDVDGAEEKKSLAFKLNAEVPGELAKICKELGIPLVHFSTNYVFDGEKGEYAESDEPHPLSVYAQSKYRGELEIQKNTGRYYIIRTAVLFGPTGQSELSKKSFIDIMLELSRKTGTIKAVDDEINSITYANDLARGVQVLLSQQFSFGTYHMANLGAVSWHDFAREIFRILKKDVRVMPVPSSEFPRKAQRPKKAVLLNTKFIEFRPWQEALEEFLHVHP